MREACAEARARSGVMCRLTTRVLPLLVVVIVVGSAGAGTDALAAADAETRSLGTGADSGGGNGGTAVSIGKCCEPEELLLDDRCTPLAETNETKWRLEFASERRSSDRTRYAEQPKYVLRIGRPRCANDEHQWHVYHYPSGPDRLAILPSGMLRHYIIDLAKSMDEKRGVYGVAPSDLSDDDDEDESATIHYDYQFGHYCVDKAVLSDDRLVTTYAMLCVPDVAVRWTDTNYLMKHAIDPAFHAVSMACYLVVAIVYFVLPQLRDLVGNIITSMTLCLVANQCASTVGIFTEFGNHVSFLIAGTNRTGPLPRVRSTPSRCLFSGFWSG